MDKQLIQAFIKSGDKSIKFANMLPIRDIEAALIQIGFDELELSGDETNGWQIDFWYRFTSKQYGEYQLSGSLHYGDFELRKL